MEKKNEEAVKSTEPQLFAMALVIPGGLTESEAKNRIQAALFALNGAAKMAGVGINQGPMLRKFVKDKLIGG